jgi:hypothetical protein
MSYFTSSIYLVNFIVMVDMFAVLGVGLEVSVMVQGVVEAPFR